MNILISNDDGIHAKGINILATTLRNAGHNVTVIAPDRNRSAASSCLTLVDPLRVKQLTEQNYTVVAGTPADCVHLALNGLFEEEFDLVVSGINHGANLGDDVIYSGTVAAALEGRHLKYPCIAVSLVEKNDSTYLSAGEHNFETAAQVVLDILQKMQPDLVAPKQILNVNVPNVNYDQLQGIEITRCGHRLADAKIVENKDPRDATVYWIGPSGTPVDNGEGTDFFAVKQNKVSITPIQADMTAHQSISALKEKF
ncbi:5'/3'-nucleotidase SurE [Phocoenobacter uteri]|uniref:5'-nucleotidase SurE n=1 Tax=Phocoenobacter uteri TaxID=146806 RepID=A0A379CAQ4_9PAST|nr:5'/3'-nucleotidase SurE [Phocoenobacter uteri]MDG6881424.1 5'/3'-nucleotidase SurE [Phocoenobacter uteri]SUB59452.1 5'/3'-nucleotidase SurE [Phocoenobacter uteri]